MKKLFFVLFISIFLSLIQYSYALTVLSGPDTDGCYDIRVDGKDITYDVSIVSELYISRDGGYSWEVVFKDSQKAIDWLRAKGEKVVHSAKIPSGHYNAVKSKANRVAKVNLENRKGRPKREVEINVGEEQVEFDVENIDMILERGKDITLRFFDNPLIYLDLHVKWDTAINAYSEPVVINKVLKKEITKSIFRIE
jgi:hypothetical protein